MTAFSLRHQADPLRPPEAPGLGRGFGFALLVHAGLVLALSAGVQWRTKTLPTFEAELWSAVPQAAAPKEVEPPPPEPEPELKPPPKPPQPSAEDLQAERDAEIAIAKARELKKKQDAAAEAERKRLKELKDQADKAERDRLDKIKQQNQERLDQKKLDKEKQDKLDKTAKDAEAKRETQRKENLRRIQGMAGASGDANATGTALKSSGPSASYGGKIVAAVRPHIIYEPGAANPVAEVEVRAAPDGTIIGKKLLKASGDPEWDKAVQRAIDKTERLPRDADGGVPSSIVISFRPRD